MLKIFSFFFFFAVVLYSSDKVEIYAARMESDKNIVNAYGEVTVVYKDYFLSAKRAKYNRDTGELELFENIHATHKLEYKLLGSYARLNIQKKERSFKPFYMLDKTSKVWLSGDKGEGKDTNIDIISGITSGCNPNDPLWKIEFSSSDYNTDSKWLNLYNARIYIYDVLVLYTPYFGYSLDTTRRTGLLTPGLGISDKEGFFYEQPLYIAPQNWWDLELRPQLRTRRGSGGYTTFRFVDSFKSQGTLTAGYFKEKDDFYKEEQLVNKSHYGYNLNYNNSDILNQWFGLGLDGQSGLYIDINNMNDVDYINLSTYDTTKNATSTQVLSRGNLFYNTNQNYIGSYFTYYKNLTLESNENTLQKLPTIQYHHYLETFLDDHLLYNVDIHSNNIYRDINKKVLQTDVNIPVILRTSLLDEYLNVAYKLDLYGQHSLFGGEVEPTANRERIDESYENGYFLRNSNTISVSTQLAKAFEDLTHVIDFGIDYIFAGSEYRDGFYQYNQYTDTPQEFYDVSTIQEQLQLNFQQYIYNTKGEQKIYHRLSQIITYEQEDDNLKELENELEYQVSNSVTYYNNMFYNYDEKAISKALNSFSIRYNGLNLSFSHLFKHNFNVIPIYESYMTSSASYTYNQHYSYSARWDYDLQTNLKKGTEIGFLYKKRCWDFGLKYVENNRPILANGEYSSVYDRYIYFTVILKPLMKQSEGTSDFSLRMPETLRGSDS